MTAIADALIAAHRTLRPIQAPYESMAPASEAQAYAVQGEVWQALYGETRPTAFKAMIPGPGREPMAAPMFAGCVVDSGATLAADRFRLVGLETETCVRFGKALPPRATPYTQNEVLDAVLSAHVGVEIVDTRLADRAAAGELWRLADSLVNGGFVVGDAISNWRNVPTAFVVARTTANGHVLAEVQGKHPTGEPYFLLPWWANTGSLRYGGIQAGDLLTLGSWTGMQLVEKPVEVKGELVGLGAATVRIA